jgi:hypothetical protein
MPITINGNPVNISGLSEAEAVATLMAAVQPQPQPQQQHDDQQELIDHVLDTLNDFNLGYRGLTHDQLADSQRNPAVLTTPDDLGWVENLIAYAEQHGGEILDLRTNRVMTVDALYGDSDDEETDADPTPVRDCA